MSVVLSRLALRFPRRLLKGLVSGVGLALALAIGSPLLAGIGVTLPTLGSALATCPAATFASSLAYGPAYNVTGTITVTFSATTGTTGCQMAYSILATGGLTTSWGDYHYDNYNPTFGAPSPPSRYPSGVAFNIHPAAQGVVHWYYNYRECASHTVPDKYWVASIYFAVSVDNGPCSGEANTNTNWTFDDHTVIYDTVAPVSSTAGGAPTYSTSRSVGVTYVSASDATSGVASVSVYRTLSATPATTDALCGTDTTSSPPTVITCATTADGLWRFYSRATDKAGNVEPLPTAADDTTIVDTVLPAAPNGTLTAQTWATQAAVNGTIYFNGNTGTSFTITSTGTDSSGIASNTFSAPAVTTGWTTTTAATVAGNPSARAYTWTSAAVATSITLKSTDNATNIGAIRTITLTDDSTAPGSGISAPAADTQNTLVSPAFSFTLSDAGSGIDAAASNWIRQWATLTANACGATWTTDTGPVSGSGAGAFSPAQAAMVNGRCYKWVLTAKDNVNNSASFTSQTIKVDTTPPAAPNGTLTAQAYATQPAVNGIVYFNGNVATSFTITSDGSDPEPASGIASSTFSAPAVTTGWTTITAATVAGDPSARAYTWTAAAVSTSITLKSTDNASNIGAIRTITLTDDSTAPAIAISSPATDTQNTLVSPAFTFTLSDAASGVDVAASNWRRRWTTLAANVCGTTWTDEAVTFVSTGGSPAQAAMVSGRCYDWIIVARDNVYNSAAIAYSNVIKVDTGMPTVGVPAPSLIYANAVTDLAPGWSVNWTAAADAISGVATVTMTELYGPVTTYASCGGVVWTVAWTQAATTDSFDSISGGANNYCYAYKVNVTDNAGNVFTSAQGAPIFIDTIAPVSNGFTVPSLSTTYTSATSATFTWNAWTDTFSGINAYHRVWQSAPVTSPGVCGAFGNLSDHGLSTALTITESGFANGTCYKEAVRAVDRAGNYGGWVSSNPYLIDTLPPPTTISTSTPCVSPGGQATFTVGRTDPSPSSNWLTSGNASTSWWSETFDGPWTGAYRLDPWPGNTNASATFDIGYPDPTVGTQAAYTRVVWTRDNAGNTTDSTVPLAQGRDANRVPAVDVTVDNTAPTSPWLTVPTYAAGLVDLSFGATAGGCSGVDQVRISNDGTNWWTSSSYLTSYTGWDLTNATYGGSTTQGTRTVYIAFREAGTSNWTQTSQTLTYDSVAPTHNGHTFSGGSNWFATGSALNPTVYVNTNVAGSVDVTAQVSDTGSGVKNVSFANPSGQAGWTYPQGVDPSPPYQVTVSWNAGADIWAGTPNSQAEDWAGNYSVWQGWTFTNDTAPPVITWTNPTADVYDTTGTVTPSWTVTDAGAGIGSVGTVKRFYLPTLSTNVCSGTPVDDGPQTSGTPTTLISGRCYYWAFTIQPTDNVGNATVTNRTSATIKVDTVHPTGTLTFDDLSGVTHSRFINASVTMADAESGPLQVRFSTDGGFSWTAWTAYVVGTPTVTPLTLASGTGTYTVLAQIQDLAGNMTPLGHSTALLNAVIEPTLGAAAKIYDCATNTLLATNTTGTIYWPVDRTLCFVPTAHLVAPGSDGTSSPTLVGTIAAPSGTPGNYVLHDPDQTWSLVGGTWPTSFVGVTRTAADTPLRFTFGRETSSLSTSTPYLTIPYDTQAVVGWYNGATLVRSETVTVTLNLRVVAKNSGTTGTN